MHKQRRGWVWQINRPCLVSERGSGFPTIGTPIRSRIGNPSPPQAIALSWPEAVRRPSGRRQDGLSPHRQLALESSTNRGLPQCCSCQFPVSRVGPGNPAATSPTNRPLSRPA
jgi:hypothetical protein